MVGSTFSCHFCVVMLAAVVSVGVISVYGIMSVKRLQGFTIYIKVSNPLLFQKQEKGL